MPETYDLPEVELWLTRKRWMHGQQYQAPRLLFRIPSLFWHVQGYPDGVVEVAGRPARPPLTESTSSTEVEEPYRTGVGRSFRLWPTRRAVVVGYWRSPTEGVMRSEVSALEEALESHLLSVSVEEIAGWNQPDEVTDDTEIMPDTAMVYDDQGRPVMREGSTLPISPEQYAIVMGGGTGTIQSDPYGPVVVGDGEGEPVYLPIEFHDQPLDFTRDDIIGWLGPDGQWHPGSTSNSEG